jgi:hypothetical protein
MFCAVVSVCVCVCVCVCVWEREREREDEGEITRWKISCGEKIIQRENFNLKMPLMSISKINKTQPNRISKEIINVHVPFNL